MANYGDETASRDICTSQDLLNAVTDGRNMYYLTSHIFSATSWVPTKFYSLHDTEILVIEIKVCIFCLLFHVYQHVLVHSRVALSTPLGSNIGGAAPVDKWALGEVVLAQTCDVSILWRSESDSEGTYKQRGCQIMQ